MPLTIGRAPGSFIWLGPHLNLVLKIRDSFAASGKVLT
jgi:hypothetical protein